MQRIPESEGKIHEGCLLIYVAPQAIFAESLDLGAFQAAYLSLLQRPADQRLIADWRLAALEPAEIAAWLKGEQSCAEACVSPPSLSDPLQALVLDSFFNSAPDLLDAYLDLELQAELAQTEVDSSYRQRLRGLLAADPILVSWRAQQQRLSVSEQELQELAAELASLQAEGQMVREQLQAESQAMREKQQAEVAKLLRELAESNQLLTQSRAETEEQLARNGVLEQELQERVAELTRVQVELADGHQLLTQSRAETEEQRTRNEVLEQEVKERVAELTKVQVELADGHQLLTQSRAETEEQRTRNEVLEQEVKERVAELASLQAESLKVREQLQTEIQAMNEQMRHVQEELEHYFFAHQQADDKNKDLVDQFQSLTQQLANCRQELDKSNLRIDDLEDQLQQRAVELASTQAEGQVVRELLQAELTNVQEQLAERNKLLTQSRTTSEEQHGRIGVLEQELQRRVVELASLQAEGHVVREQLQAESQAMNEQLRHVQEELEHYFLAHQKAEESNKNLDIRYQDATQHLSDCRQELEKSKLRIDELEDKLQQRDFELASIQSEGQKVRELLQAELSKVQEELVEQSQLLAQSRAVTQDQHGRIETLEYELKQRAVEQSSTLVQSQAMSEQLRNVQEELEHYFIKHKQAQERSNDLDNQVQSTTRQLVSSQQQLVESHSRIAVLESQVKHVQEELDHYFMFSREQSDLIDKQKQQQQRAVQMLIRCLSGNKSAIGEDLSVYHNLLKGIDQSFEVHDSKLLSVDDVQTK